MATNFHKLLTDRKSQIQKDEKTPNWINIKKHTEAWRVYIAENQKENLKTFS